MKLTRGVLVAIALVMSFASNVLADNYYSIQKPDQAPLPFNPFPNLTPIYLGSNSWAIPDQNVDYNWLLQPSTDADASIELSATATPFTFGGGFAPLYMMSFPSNSLWLEWINIDLTNLIGSILVHGTISNNTYQLLSTGNLTNLSAPANQNLILGQILTNSAGLDPMIITNVSISNPGTNFYLVHATNTILSISTAADGIAFAPTDTIKEFISMLTLPCSWSKFGA